MGLHGSTWGSTGVYVGLHGGLCRAGEHYPIKICANDVIGCGGDINQSDFVDLCRSMWVYVGLHGGLQGSMRVYVGVYAGLGNIIQSKSVPVMSLSVVRSIKCPPLFVPGYHWLPLTTIDIVGDNREFEV